MRDELTAALQARWEESLADTATDGDDGVGEVEEGVDDFLAALAAALQPVEVVVPGVSPLGIPALPSLDRGLVAFLGDFPGHAVGRQLDADLARQVRAYDLLRMPRRDGRPSPLGQAFAEYGQIAKTLHLLALLALADPADPGHGNGTFS